ncbi:zinc finger MYM-type protein 4-like isoform X2 [Meleagris gallopavo]|uniref:zinc finger MYM-type protein 4-like isoform X2 n=1 Tax=Meleagris gallopavo TaxID=9103 RepID=UPI0012ABA069|nr:zinc finger MYM-type protein 4-like isoform X2 [Meleagris gallopavo]
MLLWLLIGCVLEKYFQVDQDNDVVLSFLQFEDKSDAVFDITEKCSEILDAEMSEDTVHNLPATLDSVSYEMQNRAGSENSLLDDDDDDDYFLNSGDLASIPVVGSDNEDDQNFTPKDTLPSEDHLEEGKRVAEHELDSEKDIQIENAIQKDLTSPFEQGPVFKSIQKDFSITRDNGKETFSTKDKNREVNLQEHEKRLEKIPKDPDSRLKSSFLDKAVHNQVEETLRTQLAPQTPETNFREYGQQPKTQEGELKISAVFSVSGSPLGKEQARLHLI